MDNTQCESNCYKGICLRTGPNATFECSCNEGWGGENCEYVIGKTCEEDCEKGECVRTGFDTTSCICDPGWTGEDCSVWEGACPKSCKTCVTPTECTSCIENAQLSGTDCVCVDDYEGESCENYIG